MKHPLFSLIIAFAVLFAGALLFLFLFPPTMSNALGLEIRGAIVDVEVVQTPLEKARGLSGRAALTHGEGMLFLFDTLDRHTMWMKDMYFPIDILWIRNSRVVDLEEDVSPEPGVPDPYLTRYHSDVPAEFVLEVPAGFAKENNIVIGDDVFIRSGSLPSKYEAFLNRK